MKRIAIASGIQLINNPRAFKEALALSGAGHEVIVFAAIYDESSRE